MSSTLPLDWPVTYHPNFLTPTESVRLFEWIVSNCGDQMAACVATSFATGDDNTREYGNSKLMFVDTDLVSQERFHNTHGPRIEWPTILLPVKEKVERLTGVEFNVGVCIYYGDGMDGVGFHRDYTSFGPVDVIASLSLGRQREFALRPASDPDREHRIELEEGSVLVMGPGCQDDYEHSLPSAPERTGARINITFRRFGMSGDRTWVTGG